jgi:hypothetical protein
MKSINYKTIEIKMQTRVPEKLIKKIIKELAIFGLCSKFGYNWYILKKGVKIK